MAVDHRRATPADLDAILATLQAGLDSYVSFTPSGWQPPDTATMRELSADILSDEQTWATVALADERIVGHAAFFPGRERRDDGSLRDWRERPLIPGLANLWQLFVLPDEWGQGVAPALHDLAIEQMRGRGFTEARLYTPTLHARARRFYEKRAWYAVEARWNDGLRLEMTEYRQKLTAREFAAGKLATQ